MLSKIDFHYCFLYLISFKYVDRRIRDFLLLILMYVNGTFSMLKKQKRILHTYTFLDLYREGKAEVTWNTFQKRNVLNAKKNEIPSSLFKVKVRKFHFKILFHFKMQHAKCFPSSILFTRQCDLSLQEVDYN